MILGFLRLRRDSILRDQNLTTSAFESLASIQIKDEDSLYDFVRSHLGKGFGVRERIHSNSF